MTSNTTGRCDVCGNPGNVHLAEIRDGVKTSQSLCIEHAPEGMRVKMPFGPDCTPAEEVAFLREKLKMLGQLPYSPAQREKVKAEIERLITEIEAGRRRLGDDDKSD